MAEVMFESICIAVETRFHRNFLGATSVILIFPLRLDYANCAFQARDGEIITVGLGFTRNKVCTKTARPQSLSGLRAATTMTTIEMQK